MMTMGGGWVAEVDLKSFFDKLNHSHLQQLLRKRVHDGVLLRLDEWVEGEVKPRLKGRAFLVRFADDFVLGFSKERARRGREMSCGRLVCLFFSSQIRRTARKGWGDTALRQNDGGSIRFGSTRIAKSPNSDACSAAPNLLSAGCA